jgi:hypothetical protein
MKKFFVLGAALFAGASQAVVLFNNGPVVNGSGLSVLTLPASTLGSASNANFVLADNFSITVPSWSIQSLDFYGYQTQTVLPAAFTFTNVTWSIVSGANVNAGTTVASGTTAVTNAGLMGYRVTDATLTNQQRAIYRINVDIPDITLGAGNYFVTWALAGSGASGPFVPPVVGSLGTGNGLQAPTGGTYVAIQDQGSLQGFDVPFSINGTVVAVPEPSTWLLMVMGVGALALRRRQH